MFYIRVMDLLYAQLPKAYVEIYPHLQPTREVHSSRMMARKSWHRWWLTMAWVQHLQRQKRAASENTGYPRIEALDIESNSFKAVDRFGTAFFFPEQVRTRTSNSVLNQQPRDSCVSRNLAIGRMGNVTVGKVWNSGKTPHNPPPPPPPK